MDEATISGGPVKWSDKRRHVVVEGPDDAWVNRFIFRLGELGVRARRPDDSPRALMRVRVGFPERSGEEALADLEERAKLLVPTERGDREVQGSNIAEVLAHQVAQIADELEKAADHTIQDDLLHMRIEQEVRRLSLPPVVSAARRDPSPVAAAPTSAASPSRVWLIAAVSVALGLGIGLGAYLVLLR